MSSATYCDKCTISIGKITKIIGEYRIIDCNNILKLTIFYFKVFLSLNGGVENCPVKFVSRGRIVAVCKNMPCSRSARSFHFLRGGE